jgi:hypothetical protein
VPRISARRKHAAPSATVKSASMPREGCSVGIGSNLGFCYPNCYPTPGRRFRALSQAIELVGEPVGIRTRDLLIKSQLLYRLSYGLAAPLQGT